jgi:hypothetical protein
LRIFAVLNYVDEDENEKTDLSATAADANYVYGSERYRGRL